MFANDDDGDCDSPTTPTSDIFVEETELKEQKLDGLSLGIGIWLLTNLKPSSTVSLSF